MYDYNICLENSVEEFEKVCKRIEQAFPDVKKMNILEDVDGSLVQTYVKDGKEIDVHNDYEVGAIFIKSEMDIAFIMENLVA